MQSQLFFAQRMLGIASESARLLAMITLLSMTSPYSMINCPLLKY
ncbi:hypothetical protein LDG_7289 [Legionella drancourtii LLAP12]|uniref:Uncharacterized protein n=1 Tax=Legionella drancourtii LLAP12 TaxID=658187 RepID=G9EPU8_9GAMM|nr:hypothetical protein LDG_7289 [Legionella drancourtii LLAP12]